MKQFNTEEQIIFWKENKISFWGGTVSEIILQFSKRYIGETVIEVGAGNGSLIQNFKKIFKNKRIIGIDVVPKNSCVSQGNCTELAYPNNSFDTYFALNLIEHLSNEDLDRCLDEMSRVLKGEGIGIFVTKNKEDLNSLEVFCPVCNTKFHRWGHCQTFTETRIKSEFGKRNFKIVKMKQINFNILGSLGIIAKIFYLFKMEKIVKLKTFTDDLFFVVKKTL